MYQTTVLNNGLKIITKELSDAKTVLLQVTFKAGAKFSPPGKGGLAHFMEHMVRNGSRKYPSPLLLLRAIEELGGISNAETSKEDAHYWIKVASEDLEKAADITFSLVTDPLLDQKELPGEKKVILEEIARHNDQIGMLISDEFHTLVFGDHSLGHRGLGYPETIRGFATQDFLRFFSNFYLAQNAIVYAAGNLKHTQITELAQKYFPQTSERALPSYQPFQNASSGPQVRILRKPSQQAVTVLGFLTFPKNFTEHIQEDILTELINSKDRLPARLREKEHLAYSVGARYRQFQDASLVMANGGFSLDKIKKAVQALTEEFQKVKENPIEKRELTKIKKIVEVGLLSSLEKPSGWVDFALFGNDFAGRPIEPEDYLEEIKKISPEDVQRLAQKTFTPERAYLATVHESLEASELEKILSQGLR